MRVTFILPNHSPVPVGGFAIVYEYANGLASRGHEARVVHPYALQRVDGLTDEWRRARWLWARRRQGHEAVPWFPVGPRVRLLFVSDLRERRIPPADAVVATAWWTAPIVHGYHEDRGAKVYLLQQYETWWDASPEEIDATWRLPLHKVAIARWLAELSSQFGESHRTTYIPNGVDTGRYRIVVPIEHRPRHRVAMLFHPGVWKGVADGLEAASSVREEVPELELVVFGTDPRPALLPRWVSYRQNPYGNELVQLYNSCAVFLHPSWSEGSPLPPAEAMACGCALVAAANPGVCDYAVDGVNAVLAPVRQPPVLADALRRVIQDDELRQDLARSGRADMEARPWSECIDRFEEVIGARQPAPPDPP